MEDGQVVDVLDIALLEVRVHAELIAEEVQGVEGLGLGLGDGRDVGVAGERAEPDEGAAGVLQRDPLGTGIRRREVEHQRPPHVGCVGFVKSGMAPRRATSAEFTTPSLPHRHVTVDGGGKEGKRTCFEKGQLTSRWASPAITCG